MYVNEDLAFSIPEHGFPYMPGDSVSLEYNKHRVWAENLSIVMQIGLTMAGCIGFCFYVGLMLDRWLGFRGVFTVVFILLGIAGGANVVYRQIMEIIEPKNRNRPDVNRGSHT